MLRNVPRSTNHYPVRLVLIITVLVFVCLGLSVVYPIRVGLAERFGVAAPDTDDLGVAAVVSFVCEHDVSGLYDVAIGVGHSEHVSHAVSGN